MKELIINIHNDELLNEKFILSNEIIDYVLNKKDIRKFLTKIDENIYEHSHNVALLSTMLGINIENLETSDLEELAIASYTSRYRKIYN